MQPFSTLCCPVLTMTYVFVHNTLYSIQSMMCVLCYCDHAPSDHMVLCCVLPSHAASQFEAIVTCQEEDYYSDSICVSPTMSGCCTLSW